MSLQKGFKTPPDQGGALDPEKLEKTKNTLLGIGLLDPRSPNPTPNMDISLSFNYTHLPKEDQTLQKKANLSKIN